QIFSNLLSNAVKFVAPGVHPRVRVRAEMERESEKGANEDLGRENGRKVRICVEDNGIGIPKEQQEKIFGMFQRMHRAEEYPGTGIGLALVEKSLERTGGEITVESEPGKGSRFSILLPLAAPGTEAQVKK
ncbi:MAG TPA: ATP-binding protein, partial [Candidatus Sulfotelmatobacter sp.]|nr:ATP-binding protein [Candidatus Sulfotelmatobacter sp.]